jgi:hypothetical protein
MIIEGNSIVSDFTTKGKDICGHGSVNEAVQTLPTELNTVLNGYITLRIPEQAYFWTEEWQEAEAEADQDIRTGNVTRFSDIEDAIKFLRSHEI